MSLLVNQTAINPEVSFFAASEQGGYVASITAGTNITLTGTATNPVINAPSGENNSAKYSRVTASFSSSPGALASGASQGVFTFDSAYYPDADMLYRVTVCYEWGLATFSGGTPAGNMTLSITNNSGNVYASHNVPFTGNIANGNNNIGGMLTTVFRTADGGGALGLSLLNNTGVTLASGTIVYTTYCIEEVTTDFQVIAP
jgi:hypothetical protein